MGQFQKIEQAQNVPPGFGGPHGMGCWDNINQQWAPYSLCGGIFSSSKKPVKAPACGQTRNFLGEAAFNSMAANPLPSIAGAALGAIGMNWLSKKKQISFLGKAQKPIAIVAGILLGAYAGVFIADKISYGKGTPATDPVTDKNQAPDPHTMNGYQPV